MDQTHLWPIAAAALRESVSRDAGRHLARIPACHPLKRVCVNLLAGLQAQRTIETRGRAERIASRTVAACLHGVPRTPAHVCPASSCPVASFFCESADDRFALPSIQRLPQSSPSRCVAAH